MRANSACEVCRSSATRIRPISGCSSRACTVVKATIGAPDSEVQKSVDTAMESANLINMLNKTVPLVALILGILGIVGGLLLLRRPKEDAEYYAPTDEWGQVQPQ